MERKLISKRDTIVIAVIIAIIGLIFIIQYLSADSGHTATVTVDGKTLGVYNLDNVTDEEIITLSDSVEIRLSEHAIGFYESDCKDKICVESGMLSAAGDVAACVPNKTVIHIASTNSGNVDVITY